MIICILSYYLFFFFFFFFNDTATTEIYTLSLHDALPILPRARTMPRCARSRLPGVLLLLKYMIDAGRSEEHTSELQSQSNLVCRLLLEKKKNNDERALVNKKHKHTPPHI